MLVDELPEARTFHMVDGCMALWWMRKIDQVVDFKFSISVRDRAHIILRCREVEMKLAKNLNLRLKGVVNLEHVLLHN